MSSAAVAINVSEPKGQPFQIRGSLQTVLSLRLIDPNDPTLFDGLKSKVAHAPEFFRDAPVIIDVAPIASLPPIDIGPFCDRLLAIRINPVGMQNGSEAWEEAARAVGLAVFPSGRTAPTSHASSTGAPSNNPPPPTPMSKGAGRIITTPVRGGQQINNDDGDLVVMAPVSYGAEVAATGNIHVYSAIRGRVFAGTGGDESAMIFCESMDAQLISIAGVHMLSEEIDPRLLKKRVRVHCDGDKLIMAPLP